MVVGVIATLLAVVLNAMGAVMGARDNDGQRANAGLLARTSLSRRGMALEHRCRAGYRKRAVEFGAGVSIGVVVTVLVLTQGLPVLVVTLAQRGRAAHR
ncbi:hypothetical protein GS416_11265 [Rhodococcus hoagii]|nr:hypothetical protein [Prescottella equi]